MLNFKTMNTCSQTTTRCCSWIWCASSQTDTSIRAAQEVGFSGVCVCVCVCVSPTLGQFALTKQWGRSRGPYKRSGAALTARRTGEHAPLHDMDPLAKLVFPAVIISVLVACSPTEAWYKQVAGPSYYSVGRASGLLSGIRRSPYARRDEPEASDSGEAASNSVLSALTAQNSVLKTMVSARWFHRMDGGCHYALRMSAYVYYPHFKSVLFHIAVLYWLSWKLLLSTIDFLKLTQRLQHCAQ